jgi:hypothetical protein
VTLPKKSCPIRRSGLCSRGRSARDFPSRGDRPHRRPSRVVDAASGQGLYPFPLPGAHLVGIAGAAILIAFPPDPRYPQTPERISRHCKECHRDRAPDTGWRISPPTKCASLVSRHARDAQDRQDRVSGRRMARTPGLPELHRRRSGDRRGLQEGEPRAPVFCIKIALTRALPFYSTTTLAREELGRNCILLGLWRAWLHARDRK